MDTTDTFVFFHAHPDDESIFTGGAVARLADKGARCVLVVATSGDEHVSNPEPDTVAHTRYQETLAAAEILGFDRVEFLGYADSGIATSRVHLPGIAFAAADPNRAASRLAAIIIEEDAGALISYDEGGIYGHADHLMVHEVGRRAAAMTGVTSYYEATVDREYLHFVDTHLVDMAALSLHVTKPTGLPSVIISTMIDVGRHLDVKRKAMAAHQSQIGPESAVMQLDDEVFAAVYGYEWFVRTGPATLLDSVDE